MPVKGAWLAALLLVLVSLGGAPALALAPVCSASVGSLLFGTIDVLAGGRVDAVSTLTVTCSGGPADAGHAVRICASMGAGQSASFPPRKLVNGASGLRFEIYPDLSGATPWGSWSGSYGTSTGITIDLPLVNGGGVAQRSVYGSIFPLQAGTPPGVYTNSFADVATSFVYALDAAATPCALLGGVPVSYSFLASATVEANCYIATHDLSFGTIGALVNAVDAQTMLVMTCSAGLPYTIGLGGGRSQASDPANRHMTGPGGTIFYGLYRDAGRMQAWGASGIGNTLSGTGSAAAQSFPVYGRIHGAQMPAPGIYSDVIVVTVTY